MSDKIRSYVIDTSTILYSANSLSSFGTKTVVIPYVVLEELDRFKTRDDEVGRNARQAIRQLYELRAQGHLNAGVSVNQKGGLLRVELNYTEPQNPSFIPHSNDDRILNVCLGLAKQGPTVLVSKDINLIIRADTLGIEAQDFTSDKLISSVSDLYTGTAILQVPAKVIDNFYAGEKVYYPDLTEQTLYPNQYLTLEAEGAPEKSALARVQQDTKPLTKLRAPGISGISPRNREQQFLIDALLNKDIPLVSVTGIAGSGKTLCSLACALHLVQDEQAYNKLIVSRPIQPMGKDIGYLPGDLLEKLSPWMGPIKDAINFLRGPNKKPNNIDVYSEMVAFGLLEVEALTYIRGRSLPNTLFLIDESEDLTRAEIKTIVSRMGENSKIILIGDVMQITNPYVDSTSNGLSVVAEKFKEYPFSAHLTLQRGERSLLSTTASNIL